MRGLAERTKTRRDDLGGSGGDDRLNVIVDGGGKTLHLVGVAVTASALDDPLREVSPVVGRSPLRPRLAVWGKVRHVAIAVAEEHRVEVPASVRNKDHDDLLR